MGDICQLKMKSLEEIDEDFTGKTTNKVKLGDLVKLTFREGLIVEYDFISKSATVINPSYKSQVPQLNLEATFEGFSENGDIDSVLKFAFNFMGDKYILSMRSSHIKDYRIIRRH